MKRKAFSLSLRSRYGSGVVQTFLVFENLEAGDEYPLNS